MQLRPKVGKFRRLSRTLAQRGGVILWVDVVIILDGRPDGTEAFDFGPAEKRGFYVAVGETESIPGTVNRFTLTLKFWSHGSTHQPWNPCLTERELWI
jgi:hypothetical protein